ncbi:MAG: glycosyltransferase [Clostridia bacterium]|nr:glycosyltransferase [Clostridia bacterium]
MKVCMLVTNSLKKDPRVRREADTAHAAGLDVTVLGCYDKNLDEEFLESTPYKNWIYMLDGKYRGKLKSNFKKFLRMYLPLYNMYKKCLELKPDVIHANDFDTLPAAYFAAKKLKCAVVYDCHEIYSRQPQLEKRAIIRKVLEKIEGYMVKRIDAMLSVSNAAADVFVSMYGIKKPTVVTNTSFKVEKSNLPSKNDGFEVVYHGVIVEYRGYEEFTEAAEKIDDNVKMVIRGFGPAKEKIMKIAEEKGLCDRIEFAPAVEIKDLIPEAARSHVGAVLTVPVSDNFKYTVSNKIFEYIQARIPVILSDVPEHRYINDKYNVGIILDDVTPENIAKAINELYENKELYNTLCANVEKAAEELCWENEGKILVGVYERVVKRVK